MSGLRRERKQTTNTDVLDETKMFSGSHNNIPPSSAWGEFRERDLRAVTCRLWRWEQQRAFTVINRH